MGGEEKKINTIGVIMDGNRRFARSLGKSPFEGHSLGRDKAKEFVKWCNAEGIGNVILYVFSSENWKRSQEEVGYLMDIFKSFLESGAKEFQNEGGAVWFIGDRSNLDRELVSGMERVESSNPDNPKGSTYLAFSYGGRQEILNAVREMVSNGQSDINEETFSSYLYTNGVPDPDIIIRTGGEKRLSNFLPWQSVYSELFFTDTFWPEFSKEEFTRILEEYRNRERRMGK